MLYYDDRDYYDPENIDELYEDDQYDDEYADAEYEDYYFNLSQDIE